MASEEQKEPRGFLGRKQHLLRFHEIEECFFTRMLLVGVKPDQSVAACTLTSTISLLNFFPRFESLDALESHLEGKQFAVCNKNTELLADAMSAMLGQEIYPAIKETSAVDYYNSWLENHLRLLRDGSKPVFQPVIESYQKVSSNQLATYEVTFIPANIVRGHARNLREYLELIPRLCEMIQKTHPLESIRIDYRKQLEFLVQALDTRQKETGEAEFGFNSDDFGFRHAVAVDAEGEFSLATPGTTDPHHKVLLPLILEMNGLLDILHVSIASDPLEVNHVIVHYYSARPARQNLFLATAQGLQPETRRTLNQIEIAIYDRLHRDLNSEFVFGGREALEKSFAELCAWMLTKARFCLEEPTFLKCPAENWLEAHKMDGYVKAEDDFFLPWLHERLEAAFPGRLAKKPKEFGGEIDLLLDDSIPIELKVRKGQRQPLGQVLDDRFPPAGQAAVYASKTRLGFLCVLDLPEDGTPVPTNLDSCFRVITRKFHGEQDFATCIAVVIFHCHHPKPSSVG